MAEEEESESASANRRPGKSPSLDDILEEGARARDDRRKEEVVSTEEDGFGTGEGGNVGEDDVEAGMFGKEESKVLGEGNVETVLEGGSEGGGHVPRRWRVWIEGDRRPRK